MSRIGQEINKVRLKKGKTPKQLAKALGVSESFVLDIESGKKIVSDDMIGRISKALDFELGPIGLFASDDKFAPGIGNNDSVRPVKKVAPVASNEPVQQVWDDAFGNILKTVPVYGYKMDRIIDKKLLPIEKNKVGGFAKEKVFYLNIEDTDMAGFRVFKGDRAFGVLENQIDKDGIFLIEYNGERAVRQVKKLQGDKLLLVYNRGTLITETVGTKEIKVIARLVKLEVIL
ncbi:helix-turn-helix transcriptional regulator [Clostridium sp. BNL1100]|uniref:helix-turn-helix domain-containing protein n=1 Tax=Clostridium sp. BNL1100 TaxID=755731 RepID=UPI00024A7BF0|nr:helix-turn-helix transcriptional regulator [Clostridium sp. BNL1100]AEY67061.1 plasmid maintenance system antidote protein [Clostridium sp. BNL1100]